MLFLASSRARPGPLVGGGIDRLAPRTRAEPGSEGGSADHPDKFPRICSAYDRQVAFGLGEAIDDDVDGMIRMHVEHRRFRHLT